MFAFFGLGLQEVVLLIVVGLLIGLPLLVVLLALALFASREARATPEEVAQLRAYVEGLCEEVERFKGEPASTAATPAGRPDVTP
jgi:hypothetical protein